MAVVCLLQHKVGKSAVGNRVLRRVPKFRSAKNPAATGVDGHKRAIARMRGSTYDSAGKRAGCRNTCDWTFKGEGKPRCNLSQPRCHPLLVLCYFLPSQCRRFRDRRSRLRFAAHRLKRGVLFLHVVPLRPLQSRRGPTNRQRHYRPSNKLCPVPGVSATHQTAKPSNPRLFPPRTKSRTRNAERG